MIVGSVARGLEQEYAMNTCPPDQLPRRLLIDTALNCLHDAGYTAPVRWSVSDETGNLAYERGLASNWSADRGPFPAAYNGMRLYDDAGHFEVASPVVRNPLDSVRYSLAGEVLVYLAAKQASEQFGVPVVAYKNNLSTTVSDGLFHSVAYGTHCNLLLPRSVCNLRRWEKVRRALVPYLVTRLPLIGSGNMVPVRKSQSQWEVDWQNGELVGLELRFAISPRAGFLRVISTLDTTFRRGLINERDEPHSDTNSYWRLHDINVEALRNPFHIYIVDALQVLVMAAFQRGLLDDPPQLAQPLPAARQLSLSWDPSKWKVQLDDGRTVDALRDILGGFYLEKIAQLVAQEGSPSDRAVVELLSKVITQLATGDFDSLVHGLDWVTKLALLEEYGAHGEEALLVCNQFSLIDEAVRWYLGEEIDLETCDSLHDARASFDYAESRLPDNTGAHLQKSIATAMLNGPIDTREYLRCAILRKFGREVLQISWEKIYFHGGVICLPDCFRWGERESEQIVQRAESVEEIARIIRTSA